MTRKSLFLLLALSSIDAITAAASGRTTERSIQVLNESKSRVELFWVNPSTRDYVLMSNPDLMPGTEFPLNSYVGHEFAAREKPGRDGTCKNEEQVCRETSFQVSENDEQVIHISPEFEAIFIDTKVKARQEANDLIKTCQDKAKALVDVVDTEKALETLVDCVEGGVAGTLERVNEEIAFEASVRKNIAAHLENYTCVDDTLNSTADLSTDLWMAPDGIARLAHIKHDRPASRIHVVENFISREECDAMEAAARKSLHRATVADGKGGSKLSESRKAKQAGIKVNWSEEQNGDHIAILSRRVYDYTNHVLGLEIEEHGQEDLMSIQYEGRGRSDDEPDRYMPHCDGDCTGLPHKYGTRMATMVMYCDVADEGGHTNFRNAGVHVKPQHGDGVFFSYIDPITKLMDTGFTEHSGCPVFAGHKKIVTQWIRYGVDTENPWDSFNTLGIKYSEAREYMDD